MEKGLLCERATRRLDSSKVRLLLESTAKELFTTTPTTQPCISTFAVTKLFSHIKEGFENSGVGGEPNPISLASYIG